MIFRKMREEEREQVFRIGFEEWGKQLTYEQYIVENLREEADGGIRYVLVHNGDVLASLIVFPVGESPCEKYEINGIGSVIVPKIHRGKRYGSIIMKHCLRLLTKENPNSITLLYSDIDPNFYSKLGFHILPKPFQYYQSSVCMAYGHKKAYKYFLTYADELIPYYF